MKFVQVPWLTKRLMEQTQNARKLWQEGLSAEAIAQRIMSEGLSRSETSANIMVDNIKLLIGGYHSEFLSPKDERWIEGKLDMLVEDIESPSERCEAYHKALVLIGAYADYYGSEADDMARAEEYIAECGELDLSDEDAEELEGELRGKLIETMMGLECPSYSVTKLIESASQLRRELKIPENLIGFGEKSADLKLIVATQAYVNYINGEYEGRDVPISMDALVYAVCAGIDYASLEDEPTQRELFMTRCVELLMSVLCITMFFAAAVILFKVCDNGRRSKAHALRSQGG